MAAALAALIAMVATPSSAQRRGRVWRGIESPDMAEARTREARERSIALERAGTAEMSSPNPNGEMTPRQRRIMVRGQIREDLWRIQDFKDEMLHLTSAEAFDLKRLSATTCEIKKRASRLKSNLNLPSVENQDNSLTVPPLDNRAQVKTAAEDLSEVIVNFVKNPVLQDSNVIDAEQSANARIDLEKIIKLSGNLKKGTEKLQKVDGNKQ